MKKILALILFILISYESYSQDFFDLLTLKSQNSIYKKYNESNERLSLTKLEMDFAVPIVLKNKNVILLGGNFLKLKTNNENEIFKNYNTRSYSLKIGYKKQLNEKHSVLGMVIPKVRSDFGNLSSRNFKVDAYLSLQRKYSKNLSLSYGVYLQSELSGIAIFPLINIFWRINNRLLLYGAFPDKTFLKYNMSKNFNIGIYLHIGKNTFELNQTDTYLNENFINSFVFIEHYFHDNIVFSASLGYSLVSELGEYDIDDKIDFGLSLGNFGDDRIQLNKDVSESFLLELSLSYRIHY